MTGLSSIDEPEARPWVRHFDLSADPHQLERREWNPRKMRERADFRGIVLHSWASPVGTTAANRARFGEEEALARRALATPYTICAGVAQYSGAPVVVLAHPLERHTNASDAGCGEWLAVGVMGRFPFSDTEVPVNSAREYTPETPTLQAAVGAALDLAVALLMGPFMGATDDAGPFALITHRQTINGRGDHRECPGEAVVRMALRSSAVARGLLVPEPDLVLVPQWGRPWPAAWRGHLPAAAPKPSPKHQTMLAQTPAPASRPAPAVQSIQLDDD